MDEAGEQILADFQQYYGLNLAEILRPGSTYSPRHVLILIRQLPLEARTVAHLRGGEEFRGWGMDRYMLAGLIDAVNYNTYAVVAANSQKKPKQPEPVTRPDDNRKKKKRSNEFAAMAYRNLHLAKQAEGRSE